MTARITSDPPFKPNDQLEAILARIQRGYPSLHFRMVDGAPVPAARFPVQPGLAFEVGVNVQRDELHLTAGEHFWIEMFPSSGPALIDQFVDAVLGLVSGRCRIVESYERDLRLRGHALTEGPDLVRI